MKIPMVALILMACDGQGDPQTSNPPAPVTPTPDPVTEPLPEGDQVVDIETRDGVSLQADWYPGSDGAPAVLLLHMIPPNYDRTSWPADFIADLRAKDWSVLALDRRGAGASGGDAAEAYTGPNGKFDVEAAVQFLQEVAAGDLAIIGASNGTTSLLDYSAWAAGEGLPAPVVVGLMTGGTYTETQNDMSTLPTVPAIFTYSTAESAWSVDQQEHDPGTWSFLEYPDGAHGTLMFDVKPEVKGDLIDFLAPVLDATR